MQLTRLFLSLAAASAAVFVDAADPPVEEYDVLQYIDPLIGSANGGTCCFEARQTLNHTKY